MAVQRQAIALEVNEDFRVATADDATAAADALQRVKGMHKQLQADRTERTRELKNQIAEIEAEYIEPHLLLTRIEQKLKAELLVFRGEEQRQLEEQRRLEAQTAEQERVRLEQAAQRDREAAQRRADKLIAEGKEAAAASALRQGEANAAAKERTAAMVSAPVAKTAPTKLAGTSFRSVWKGKVTNLREFLAALLKSPYSVEDIVSVKQQPLDRLAASLQVKMDEVLPGSIAWEDEGIAARSK